MTFQFYLPSSLGVLVERGMPMKNVDLKVILKPIWDFLKKFRKKQKKTSNPILINNGVIHIDKIEINVTLKNK